jgi:hypothetical protein
MPKNHVSDLITDQEMAFASKPRVRAYMLELRRPTGDEKKFPGNPLFHSHQL